MVWCPSQDGWSQRWKVWWVSRSHEFREEDEDEEMVPWLWAFRDASRSKLTVGCQWFERERKNRTLYWLKVKCAKPYVAFCTAIQFLLMEKLQWSIQFQQKDIRSTKHSIMPIFKWTRWHLDNDWKRDQDHRKEACLQLQDNCMKCRHEEPCILCWRLASCYELATKKVRWY